MLSQLPRRSVRRPAGESTKDLGARAERRARWFYRLRGYRVLAANVRTGGVEVDLVVRRGRRIVFCEVKAKHGDRYGEPAEMIDPDKQRRLRRAAEAWLARNPKHCELELSFELVAVRDGRLERLGDAF